MLTNTIMFHYSADDESSESEGEMEVDSAAPYSTASGAKHDLMHKQEVLRYFKQAFP